METGWDIFRRVWGDGARPWATWFLCACIGIACLIPATSAMAIPAATAIVLANIGARSIDKRGQANIEIAKVQAGKTDE